MVPMRYAHRSP
jgi:hypothetical protein